MKSIKVIVSFVAALEQNHVYTKFM